MPRKISKFNMVFADLYCGSHRRPETDRFKTDCAVSARIVLIGGEWSGCEPWPVYVLLLDRGTGAVVSLALERPQGVVF